MLRPSSATFLPLPSDTILLFSLHAGNPDGSSDQFFVVHLDRFSAVINLDSDREDLDVEWAEWGPQCTRWLDEAELSTHYITTTAGQRMVTIPHDAPQHPAPIRILDFNSATIEAQRARGAVDGPHAVVRVVETSTQSLPAFAEPIVSEVPYVEITSKQHFDYGAVLINDANVIGARVRFFSGSFEFLFTIFAVSLGTEPSRRLKFSTSADKFYPFTSLFTQLSASYLGPLDL
jgi:hypothetical protein